MKPIFPPEAGNSSYRGQKAALWIFGILLLLRTIIGFNSIINSATVASSADGIPLHTFPADAAATVIAMFALNGVSRLMMSVIGLAVLVRYRALIPMMFSVFLLDQGVRTLVTRIYPIPRAGSPPAPIIIGILLILSVVGLALSLWPRRA